MYSNYICNYAWFSSQEYNPQTIIDYIIKYNSISEYEDNYMTENFANTYFSYNDCSKIGFIREDIEENYRDGNINDRERAILITSLLYAMDKIAKTCGHYDAYRNNADNKCFNKDANELVKEIYADLVYIDPPYNSRQYCDAYHLLENVARWEKPDVFGVAKKMNRDKMKSKYCTQSATEAFEDLIKNINAKYILFSYNNMATKGNGRSNAKIADEDIMRILQSKGTVKVFSESYKAFSAGKSNIANNAERLFLCTCFSEEQ